MRLTKVHVYEKMEYPWYRKRLISDGLNQEETAVDVGFSMGAKNAGFQSWCDFDYPVYHDKRTITSFKWRKK